MKQRFLTFFSLLLLLCSLSSTTLAQCTSYRAKVNGGSFTAVSTYDIVDRTTGTVCGPATGTTLNSTYSIEIPEGITVYFTQDALTSPYIFSPSRQLIVNGTLAEASSINVELRADGTAAGGTSSVIVGVTGKLIVNTFYVLDKGNATIAGTNAANSQQGYLSTECNLILDKNDRLVIDGLVQVGGYLDASLTTGNSSIVTTNSTQRVGQGIAIQGCVYTGGSSSAINNLFGSSIINRCAQNSPAACKAPARATNQTIECASSSFTANCQGVLPVTLTSFTASRQAQNVSVKWTTANELNNAFFEVQRSTDSKTFVGVGKVTGNGTTATGASYSFTDHNPQAAASYYRLRQVDTDGTASYSSVVAVSGTDKIEAAFYPNPTNSQVTLPAVSGLVTYRIYAATGQNVATGQAVGGSVVDIQHVPMGVYFLELISADKHNVQRFVKQ